MLIKLLAIYSSVVTTVLTGLVLAGSVAAKPQSFDEIDVRRINIREPDGTLRMVISNRARLPGVVAAGKEHPPVDRPFAGMLFYNDEGDENGGLVFSGRRDANGDVADSGGMLTFDRYAGKGVPEGLSDRDVHVRDHPAADVARCRVAQDDLLGADPGPEGAVHREAPVRAAAEAGPRRFREDAEVRSYLGDPSRCLPRRGRPSLGALGFRGRGRSSRRTPSSRARDRASPMG